MSDDDLRALGFVVISRPRVGQATWRHPVDGKVMTVANIIDLLARDEMAEWRLREAARGNVVSKHSNEC